MIKALKSMLLCCVIASMCSPAFAQEDAEAAAEAEAAAARATNEAKVGWAASGSNNFGSAFGAGLVIIGAAFGIAYIGGQAVAGMSRQPEAAGNIQTAMIISAALIEGATFFALIVCMLFNYPT